MNVASLENCKELYELSGWDSGVHHYWNQLLEDDRGIKTMKWFGKATTRHKDSVQSGVIHATPAYDLGYLVRKLPLSIPSSHDLDTRFKHLILHPSDGGRWTAYYTNSIYLIETDTPEDALCLLAIELFKQGVLTKDS